MWFDHRDDGKAIHTIFDTVRSGELLYVWIQACSFVGDQSIGVQDVKTRHSFLLTQASRHHRLAQKVRHSHSSASSSNHHELEIFDVLRLLSLDFKRPVDPRKRRCCCPLDVIVEHVVVVAVALQQLEGVIRRKVFELKYSSRPPLHDRGHEFIHEFHVVLAFQPRLPQPEVVRIIDQFLVVCADVQHTRQHTVRMEAGSANVEVELSDADAYATDPQVSEP
mmetsp:Transcript_31134/g.54723  ORF Transcript_31134/g.54723 Transcript_31134/m.54723 type:complete len:222 (+) Transcript_31134:852-1517(+)